MKEVRGEGLTRDEGLVGSEASPSESGVASTVVLSALFTVCGVGIALLGSTLPTFLAHWSLNDREGGLLLFVAWAGSTLGALLSRGKLSASVARGTGLVAVSSLALIYARRLEVLPLFLCYGLGLGITMTSISLLRAQRAGAGRSQELNRLNLLWAVGAFACPTLTARALATSSITDLFAVVGSVFAVLCVCVVAVEPRLPSFTSERASRGGVRLPSIPIAFCAVATLAVGIESLVGGWLTTYARRTDHSIAGAVSATSAFWAGLLVGRAINSTSWSRRFSAVGTLKFYVWLVPVTLGVLIFAHRSGVLLLLTFVLGCGLGPLYPLLLGYVLPRFSGNRVFLSAGLGAAVLPWLTGLLSSKEGSLRDGFVIALAAGCALLLLVQRMPSERSEG